MRVSRTFIAASLAALVLVGAGCAAPAPSKTVIAPAPSVNAPARVVPTGVRGVVLVGPTCPVERIPPDPKCAPHPLAVDLVVTKDGKEVARGRSGDDGMFSFDLPPGAYVVARAPGGAMLPRVMNRSFTVTADGYVQVTVDADSGIR